MRAISFNILAQRWEKRGDVPFANRVGAIARIIAKCDLALLQECFAEEAKRLRQHLGSGWDYYNNGPNTIMWRRRALTSMPNSGSSVQLTGPDDRRLVRMRFIEGFYGGSSHLSLPASLPSNINASSLRAAQSRQIAVVTSGNTPVVYGMDTNSKAPRSMPSTPRNILRKAGFGLPVLTGKGVDEVFYRNMEAAQFSVLNPGTASDHNAILFSVDVSKYNPFLFTKGADGALVYRLQRVLKVVQDGMFGNDTGEALAKWQKANGLDDDKVVGPKTIAVLAKKNW